MSEDKIVSMDKEKESDPKTDAAHQEKIAGELGQQICDLIGDHIENKNFHPLTATLLIADIASIKLYSQPSLYTGAKPIFLGAC